MARIPTTRAAAALAAFLTACSGGSDDKDASPFIPDVVETDETDGAGTGDTTDTAITRPTDPPMAVPCPTPSGTTLDQVCVRTVHGGEVTLPSAGSDDPLVIAIAAQLEEGPPEQFVGTARGSRAFIGLHQYDGVALSSLGSISYDVELVADDQFSPNFELLVDLGCDGAKIATVEAAFVNLGTPEDVGDGVGRYTVFSSEQRWTTTTQVRDPVTEEDILGPVGSVDTPPAPLDRVIAAYPDACLRNATAFDLKHPRGQEMSAVLVSLGRAAAFTQRSIWNISRIAIGDTVHALP